MKQRVKTSIENGIVNLTHTRNKIKFKKKIRSIINKNISIKKIDEKEINEYWKYYGFKIDTSWHKAYISANGQFDVRYIPESLYYNSIEPTLNDQRFLLAYTDKNSYSRFLKDVNLPETIIKNIKRNFYESNDLAIDRKEAESLFKMHSGKFIIKPSLETYGGKNVNLIEVLNSEIYLDDKKITFNDLIKLYKSDFCIQRALKQYNQLSNVYPHSINTIRILTYRNKLNAHVLSSVIRFGNKGSIVDNGGISCGVDSDGNLKAIGIDKGGKKYSKHPYTDVVLEGVQIPEYQNVCEVVKATHKQLPYFDLISWDVAIDQSGQPVIIEFNVGGQEINFHQFNNGALFGEFTEEILNRIKNK